ncbi:MAG: hypothetical protein J1F39_03295 [Clostridiales bacterium]|nr:hypothetical protein [Clostridiales bacterium]
MIKKILIVILTLLLALSFAGCGTFVSSGGIGRPVTDTSGSGNGSQTPGGENPGGEKPGGEKPGDEPEKDVRVFTVTLVNAPAVLPEGMQAIWTKNNEVHSAEFVDGVAKVEGLNGEYHVTLSALPKGYTYDCNGYNVDNFDRDVEIELLEIINLREYFTLAPNGESDVRWYKINKYGTYRATIKNDNDAMGFSFKPTENGSFSITSWCDVTANDINPTLRRYNGTESFCTFAQEIRDGGSSGTFTKNFRFASDFGDENIGAVLMFTVKAAVNGISYPITVDFTLKREADYVSPDINGEPYYATGPFKKGNENGAWRYIYEDNATTVTTKDGPKTYHIQDDEKVVFNPTDKFYHVGTADGPLLYARLTKDCQVFVTLSLPGGAWVNKGFFWNELDNGMVRLSLEDGFNYSYMINNGYANYCDSNGAHPVTEEIKRFLQGYAARENLFRDGEGVAENAIENANEFTNQSGLNLQSDEDSMWLFACGYYK